MYVHERVLSTELGAPAMEKVSPHSWTDPYAAQRLCLDAIPHQAANLQVWKYKSNHIPENCDTSQRIGPLVFALKVESGELRITCRVITSPVIGRSCSLRQRGSVR